MYVIGETEKNDFPLILTIGREPNYGDVLTDEIGIIDVAEFSAMKGGVWVTAYTQFAKQYLGEQGSSGVLKNLCFQKNASPIVFTNAFPMGIPNEVSDKHAIRAELIDRIPAHVDNLFSKEIINRVKLVVQHGSDSSEPSKLASKLIKEKCSEQGIPYCSTAFFYNGNSAKIQSSLRAVCSNIKAIFDEFNNHS
tara:strand:+ start:7470 stop:8051 length:582 start_codon:yes stop_codon:yes gene_type:complete